MIVALACLAFALGLSWEAAQLGGPAWALLWPASSSLVVAGAYAARAPGALGKRPDGTIAPWALAFHGVGFVCTWAVWWLGSVVGRAAGHEVAPGLWVGRRPFARDLPPGTSLVVDLTAEFPALRAGVPVHLVPTLDGTPPEAGAAAAAVEAILAAPPPVWVHCAAGKGRSATLAAVVVVRRGLAPDVDAAEALLRRGRPGVRLSRGQRALARALVAARPGARPGP